MAAPRTDVLRTSPPPVAGQMPAHARLECSDAGREGACIVIMEMLVEARGADPRPFEEARLAWLSACPRECVLWCTFVGMVWGCY